MGGRGSEVQILSPRPLPPDIGGSRDAASVFVSGPRRRPPPPRSPNPPPGARRMIALLQPLAALLAAGLLLWRAHLGNWELAAAELARQGYDVSAIARPQRGAALERWFARRRDAAGVRIVARCPGAIEARRVLRQHGLLALLGDRRFG